MKKPPDLFRFSHITLLLAPCLLLNHHGHSSLLQPHQIKASHHHIFSPFLPNFCNFDPSITASSWCKHDSAYRSTVCPHKSTGINWRSTSLVPRAAEFHGTSDVDALGIGNPEPLLVSLSKFSSFHFIQGMLSPLLALLPLSGLPLGLRGDIFFHGSILVELASRPWWSRLVLNILELPHDASTLFNSIVFVLLIFSTPPCAMEAHVDPRSKIICLVIKRKVLLYEFLPSNMNLLFVIEVATVREMQDNISENTMMSDGPKESNHVPIYFYMRMA
ncbi:hypothetical protein Cgig2_015842 [Carnegiea gigantea]|uniref:Uncharacterized protein n=1 Tax=Carnegiea gigantea TaxID=171969 RepID=A0A9Q1KIB8_9CARY|nr:hypothetical protein Cgig2_015842 [Carnegiea gigantea]